MPSAFITFVWFVGTLNCLVFCICTFTSVKTLIHVVNNKTERINNWLKFAAVTEKRKKVCHIRYTLNHYLVKATIRFHKNSFKIFYKHAKKLEKRGRLEFSNFQVFRIRT